MRRRLLAAGLLLAGLLLGAGGAWSALSFAARFPEARAALLTATPRARERVQRELAQAVERGPLAAREGYLLSEASRAFARALRDPRSDPGEAHRRVAELTSALPHTSLGRLQSLAARLLALERAGTPIERWWPDLRADVTARHDTTFTHFERELSSALAGAFERLRVAPGTARVLAGHRLGHPHGPFAQFLVDRLLRVADELARRGDPHSADACRTLLARMLRAWVIEPGPAGTRLLAADLLARVLDAGDSPAPPDAAFDPVAAARDLRAWRDAYHRAAGRRAGGVLAHHRVYCPDEAATVEGRVLIVAGLGIGLGAAVLTTIGLGAWQLIASRRAARLAGRAPARLGSRRAAPRAARSGESPSSSRDPRGACARGRGTTAALVAWTALAAGLWLGAENAKRAQDRFEAALGRALADPISALCGPEADRLLDSVRAWRP